MTESSERSGSIPAELRSLLREVEHAGCCSHPIRLAGLTADRLTGEMSDRQMAVACKDRRAVICPACSKLYKADAWHLVAAGLRGGKGVPENVVGHPRLFATFTAPGFGSVHSRPAGDEGGPCNPRRRPVVCPHGVELACGLRHGPGDAVLGEPLCAGCFDYEAAVLWNAHASRLWQRTSLDVVRALGHQHGVSQRSVRSLARVSFVKVAEFQRRGLVHFHGVLRGDGPGGPGDPAPSWLDAECLAAAVARSCERTTVAGANGERIGWGTQLDIRVLDDPETGPDRVASYVAKYATKTSDDAGVLARPVHSTDDLDRAGLRPHHRELVRTALHLGSNPALADLRLRAHAHTFGYAGHPTTKSRRYSTTFGALRQARADRAAEGNASITVEGTWIYTGRGYRNGSAADLADALNRAATTVPRTFPKHSPDVPHASDQG